jgi:hypothetical protein
LQKGNDAFDTVLEKYGDDPLSVYAALVHGVNAARDFKHVGADNQVSIRKHNAKLANTLISKVFQMSNEGDGVDHITLNYAMCKAAECHHKSGDKTAATKTLEDLKSFLNKQHLEKHELKKAHAKIDTLLND